jgi:transposase
VAHAEQRLVEPEPVKALGIDETRRGRAVWRFDAREGSWVKLERFETNFVDLDGSQGLLGQASGRRKANVVAWLDERGQAWKDQVAIVAMDPCATYARRCSRRCRTPWSSPITSTWWRWRTRP